MLKTSFRTQYPRLWQIAALAYSGLLTLVLLQSSSQPFLGPAAPPGPPDPGRELLLTIGHVIGFSLLVWLWWRALLPAPRALLIAVLVSLTLGFVTEVLQNLVPDRSTSWFDLVTNIVVTLVAAWIIQTRWENSDEP